MEKWRERGGLIGLLIVLGAFLIGAQTVFEEIKENVGSDVTLVPRYSGDPSEINWRVNVNRLVDMERRPQVAIRFYLLEDRAKINHINGNLTINKVTKEDSGVYIAEALVNSFHQYTNITLTVLPVEEPSGPSVVIIVLLVILVLILIIIFMGLCYWFQNRPGVKPIYNCLTCCKNHYMILLFRGAFTLITCCRQSRDSDNKTGTEKLEGCITVKIPTDAMCLVDESRGLLEDHLKRNQCLTIHWVKPADYGEDIAEALLSNGKKCIFTIKETKGDDDVIIKPEGDRVTLTVPNTEKVTKLDWKKGGVTLFEWAVSDLKFHTNNISLEPGSVTVNNAEGKGSYKVNFQLEERPESQSIGSVTFHPNKVTSKTQITWKKEGQPVNIGGNRIQPGPNGNLTINNVTSEDKGKYTIQCNDKKLDQEFILNL